MLDDSQSLLPADELKKKFDHEGISLDRPISNLMWYRGNCLHCCSGSSSS
ncbi:hypothetical protein LIER_07612 [Lithospermum erythrorhizon]|uniref:Uncharacterized protein n=1 Tax=Lithospermum erythrorhizon TaxID=34254 RepID=A0AAV3P8Q4_LITER